MASPLRPTSTDASVVPGTDLNAAFTYAPASSGGPSLPASGPSIGPLTPVNAGGGSPGHFYVPSSAQVSIPHRTSGSSSGGADLLPNLTSWEEDRFAIGMSAASLPMSSLPGEPMKTRMEEHHSRHILAHFFTVGLLCLFGSPMIVAWNLGMDSDVAYWISAVGMFSLSIPLYVIIMHFVQLRALQNEKPLPKYVFLWIVLLPAIFFSIIGGIYYTQGKHYAADLSLLECAGDNLVLQKAYTTAQGLWNACVASELQKNGGKPLIDYPSIQSCPDFKSESNGGKQNWKGYDNREMTFGSAVGVPWRVEWDYLAHLEVKYECASWCHAPEAVFKPRLWSTAGAPAEPCQNFVAHKMLTVEYHGWNIMWFGLLTIIFSIVVFLLLKAGLSNLGHK